MKRLKNFVFFVSVFVYLFLFITPSLAVIKTAGDLELTGEEPLFSSDIVWYPGLKETALFQVKNKGKESQKLMIKAKNIDDPNNLSEIFYIEITKNTETLYGNIGKTLADFFAEDGVFLSEIDKESLEEYQVEIEMDKTAGNKWQDKNLSFDFKFWFSEKEEEAVMVSGVVAPGAATAPVCLDAKPGTPTNFSAVAGPGIGEVTLSWTAPSLPYTYFLIAYSDSPDWPPKWGNPDIGNVTTFIVSGLGSGTYWFWLRAGNGCMPGDFVGPVSPGVIPGLPGAPVAPGFFPGVLGKAIPSAELEGELGEALATEEGEVVGVGISPWNWRIWIPVGIGVLGGLAFLYFCFFFRR